MERDVTALDPTSSALNSKTSPQQDDVSLLQGGNVNGLWKLKFRRRYLWMLKSSWSWCRVYRYQGSANGLLSSAGYVHLSIDSRHRRSHFLQSKHQTCVLRWIAPRWKQHVSPKYLCPSTHFTASYFRRQQSSGYFSILLSLACPPFTFCKQFVCPHYHATPAERGRVLFRGCSPMVEAHCRYQ